MTPLAKRLPRELRRNIGKYLGIFLLMCGSIALTSGFLLAAHSIGCLIDDMRDAYTIEDGRVTTSFEATKDQLKAAKDAAEDVGGVTFYKNFSIDAIIKKAAGDDGTKRTLRTYGHRTKVDIASYCEGRQPRADDEVAIDRVFATNNDLAVGDKVELEGRIYTICGIMTQPDSQALFLNNSDFTVNTITYGVAEVTDAGFAALEDAGGAPAYTYSFTFTDRDLPTADRIDAEQDMVEALTDADARVDDLIDKASKIDTDNDDIHPVNTTDNGAGAIAQAEKYAVYQLQYDRGDDNGEETISVYGISANSRYWKGLNIGDGHVVFGGGLLDKFGWSEGQKVTLSDKYEGEHYSLEYAGKDCAWGSKSDMNIYMSIDDFNELFGNDAAYFNGYVSDEKLDLDARYFAGDTTPDDMRAVGDQFIGMMSKMIGMMIGLAVFIFLLFMYLLTKAVIDHSARSISYMKVFGYRDGEISHLYIRSITLCVVASLMLSLPVIIGSLTAIFRSMLLAYNGNIEIYVPAWSMAACIGIGFATYLVVALLHTRSIKRVSLAEALKVQE